MLMMIISIFIRMHGNGI